MLPNVRDFPDLHLYLTLNEKLLTAKDTEAIKYLCSKMIALTPSARADGQKYNSQLLAERPLDIVYDFTTAEPFKRLAIIYEKEGNIKQAIQVCDYALSFGFTDDGTKSGMEGRISKLKKKAGY